MGTCSRSVRLPVSLKVEQNMDRLTLKGPFPARKASLKLRDDLLTYLHDRKPDVGSPFFSDSQLVNLSGLSRKAVRKAMDSLQREGWIDRQTGKGSFVGVRAGVAMPPQAANSGNRRALVRLAVLVYCMAGSTPNWYAQEILSGLDEMALEQGISVELLGNYTTEVPMFSRRLQQSRPDALVVMPATTRHAFWIAEAERMGIPCLLTGTRFLDLHLPTVCEDDAQGAALAVRHLAGKGHRRIGLLQRPDTDPWTFRRHEGYVQGLAQCGIEPDERLTCWLSDEVNSANTTKLKTFLDKQKPTALLLTSAWLSHHLHVLVKEGLRIPGDLSIISFDQFFEEYQQSLGLRPTIVELPLRQFGHQLAAMARQLVEHQILAQVTCLPCSLLEGESVATCQN